MYYVLIVIYKYVISINYLNQIMNVNIIYATKYLDFQIKCEIYVQFLF